MKKLVLVISVIALMTALSFAAAGSSSGVFLKNGIGARAVGMGDTGTAIANDGNSVFWNPGGSALLDAKAISIGGIMWNAPLAKDDKPTSMSSLFSVGAGVPFGMAAINLGLLYNSYGNDMIKTDKDGNKDGTFGASDMGIFLGGGYKVNDNIGVGINSKILSFTIDSESASSFAVDAGMKYKEISKGLDLGATVKNIGSKVSFSDDGGSLPMELNLGAAYTALSFADTAGVHNFITALDFGYGLSDSVMKVNIGLEYGLREMVFFRLGYRVSPGTVSANTFSAGIGGQLAISETKIGIDLAFLPQSQNLGNKTIFSVGARF